MKETVKTLRAYFILSGLSGCFWVYLQSPAIAAQATRLLVIVLIIDAGFALAYLYAGGFLPELLRNSSGRIIAFLQINFVWSCINFLLVSKQGIHPGAVAVLILRLLVVWYLLRNVRRLAAEAQAWPPPRTIEPV